MMSLNDTIVACATPAGYSSIAVVRLSGSTSRSIIKTIFIPLSSTSQDLSPNRTYYGNLVDPANNEVLDKVMLTYFSAPNSYTGEDAAEISCHGNPLIIERIVDITKILGARIAEPGEFTKRALLNNKIDLVQAEAVVDMVHAPCDEARKIALTQYEGKLSQVIYDIKAQIIDILSLVEATIDFPEEEDVQNRLEKSASSHDEKLNNLILIVDDMLSKSEIGKKIKEGYRVLIIGRGNVGKSTLFNRMVGYDRAIIHEEPGTTRDYIDECIELCGLYVRLYDTAGLLDRATGSDLIAQERSLNLLESADLILLIFDGTQPMNEQDISLYDMTKDKKRLLIVNKIDLNMRLDESTILGDSVKLSAKTGKNVAILNQSIKNKLMPGSGTRDILLTRHRHIEAFEKMRSFLVKAKSALSAETMAFELYAGLDVIAELTGRVMRRDILDRIFSEFCIGK